MVNLFLRVAKSTLEYRRQTFVSFKDVLLIYTLLSLVYAIKFAVADNVSDFRYKNP